MKVLHVLESSIPDSGGYTVRAQAIVDQQRRLGLDPVVVTSPLFPAANSQQIELFDGIRYYRTNHIPRPPAAGLKIGSYLYRLLMVRRYQRAVREIVEKEQPDVIHCHSSYLNLYAALPAARRGNLPLIYEVRTLWGESAVIEDGLKAGSWKHRLVWRLELGAMRKADAVVPIARGIFDELARRGVDSGKMTIVPNGVDSARFSAMNRDEERARKFDLAGKFVIGFIGSVRRLEGLSTLVQAYAICRSRTNSVRLVIVGDGPGKADLQKMVSDLSVPDVTFTGNVPHQDVAAWYSVMDVMVYPRIKATINERVTPLKPLEAMALGKVCVGSNVGGLRELIEDGKTGVIFPSGDATALAEVILGLMDDELRMQRLRESAMKFVREERDWGSIISRTRNLYEKLIREKSGGADSTEAFSR